MTSKSVTSSDEGKCSSWIPVLEDQNLRERGVALAVGILRDPYLAEDIVHDVYIRLFTRHSDKKIDDMPNYFLKSVKNRCLSALRSRWRVTLVNGVSLDEPVSEESKEATMEVPDSRRNPEMNAEHAQEIEIRQRIINSSCEDLNDFEKALVLAHFAGDNPTKIAHDRGENLEEIQVAMNRVIAKIRHRVKRDLKKQHVR